MSNLIKEQTARNLTEEINTYDADSRGGHREATQEELENDSIQKFQVNYSDRLQVRDKTEVIELPFSKIKKLQTSNYLLGEIEREDVNVDNLWVLKETGPDGAYKLYQRAAIQDGLVLPNNCLSYTRNFKLVFDNPGTHTYKLPYWVHTCEGYVIDGGNAGLQTELCNAYYHYWVMDYSKPLSVTVGHGGERVDYYQISKTNYDKYDNTISIIHRNTFQSMRGSSEVNNATSLYSCKIKEASFLDNSTSKILSDRMTSHTMGNYTVDGQYYNYSEGRIYKSDGTIGVAQLKSIESIQNSKGYLDYAVGIYTESYISGGRYNPTTPSSISIGFYGNYKGYTYQDNHKDGQFYGSEGAADFYRSDYASIRYQSRNYGPINYVPKWIRPEYYYLWEKVKQGSGADGAVILYF